MADGLEVEGQKFHELPYYEKVYPDYGVEFFDSVLGLAFEGPGPTVLFNTLHSPARLGL
jgi:hypothetical protein